MVGSGVARLDPGPGTADVVDSEHVCEGSLFSGSSSHSVVKQRSPNSLRIDCGEKG